jgi:hypothetical protein
VPRDKGGLGVKNLELFNLALLSKWKWRMLSDVEAMWMSLIRFRYGHPPSRLLGDVLHSNSIKESIWWKDIVDSGRGFVDDWFRSNAACIVGNGKNIGFWKFKWYGNHTFKDLYPDLFAKEVVKDVMIADRLSLEGVNNTRMWQWIAPLSVLELQQLNNLIVLLAGFSLHPNRPDSWRWIPGSAGIFFCEILLYSFT